MSNPTFSVIIASHNGADRISRVLDSCVQQSYKNFELIVVCDACDDNTEEIAKSYGAKTVVVDYHRGGLALNAGIDIATGDWVLFIDDDDWWLHEFVFQQLASVCLFSEDDAVFFSIIWKHVGYIQQTPNNYQRFTAGHCWRRSLIGDTRNKDWEYSFDLDFTDALLAKNPVVTFINMPMYYYNYMREGSLSDRHRKGEI